MSSNRKQAQINKNNVKENRTRIPHEYQVGDQALMNDNQAYKYEPQRNGVISNTSNQR